MSSPLAGRFQDHYEVLAIDPKSDSDTVQRAYSAMVDKYQGDRDKLESINLAFEVLSDPDLRGQFNKLKGISDEEEGGPKFTGPAFFDALGRDNGLRNAMLCVLYDRRRHKPFTPSLSMRHIENIVNASPEELFLAVWYLKQKELVTNDEKSSLVITVKGMDHLEANRPSFEMVMPFIKPEAVSKSRGQTTPIAKMVPKAPPPAPVPQLPATDGDSRMSIIRKALTR